MCVQVHHPHSPGEKGCYWWKYTTPIHLGTNLRTNIFIPFSKTNPMVNTCLNFRQASDHWYPSPQNKPEIKIPIYSPNTPSVENPFKSRVVYMMGSISNLLGVYDPTTISTFNRVEALISLYITDMYQRPKGLSMNCIKRKLKELLSPPNNATTVLRIKGNDQHYPSAMQI